MDNPNQALVLKRTWPRRFHSISCIFIQYGLDQGFLSENIRGDVNSAGRPTHAHFLLNYLSERSAPRVQL